jgi:hypothetical protein
VYYPKTVTSRERDLERKQRSLYLFDYGGEWMFKVEFVGEGVSEEIVYLRILG